LVLLLNSDVSPRPNFIKVAAKHFEKDKGDLFAVGLADYSHEDGKIIVRGRGGAKFKKGFLSHFKASSAAGETLWVSGGSSLVARDKFLELGGFDDVYAPFYWEDIDLCYRAQKSGYTCLFEPESRVDHFHEEGAIKKNYSNFFVKIISFRNQFIFIWKNISHTSYLLAHILWLPYHLAKSIVTINIAFLAGFVWAIIKVPALIFNSPRLNLNSQLTDSEVLKKFEKL
ncbi:glycosyltransferase family 2 protein, partial [Candidatus Curtissbacteria bacterium]|nr:glycosyltransferase family 2 protein [Candidatus Curtissbacteria bacterium]